MPEVLKKSLLVLPVTPLQILKPKLLTFLPSPLQGIVHALSHISPILGPHPSCHWCQSHSLVFTIPSLLVKLQVKPVPLTLGRAYMRESLCCVPNTSAEKAKLGLPYQHCVPYSQDTLYSQAQTESNSFLT